jgi:hypothetical protein
MNPSRRSTIALPQSRLVYRQAKAVSVHRGCGAHAFFDVIISRWNIETPSDTIPHPSSHYSDGSGQQLVARYLATSAAGMVAGWA